MDTSQYLDLFIDETKEHLQSLNEHVLVLEKEPENEDFPCGTYAERNVRHNGLCSYAASDP